MTAYELFERAYTHHMGQFLGHLWDYYSDGTKAKKYIRQRFDEILEEYTLEYAESGCIIITYGVATNTESTNKTLSDTAKLQSIDAKAGYYLCSYDGHNGDWRFFWYETKTEVKVAYKRSYLRYFRYQDWFWTIKISDKT